MVNVDECVHCCARFQILVQHKRHLEEPIIRLPEDKRKVTMTASGVAQDVGALKHVASWQLVDTFDLCKQRERELEHLVITILF